jgi:hypothetical protein
MTSFPALGSTRLSAVSTLRQRPRSGRLQGFSRGQDSRERILALRNTGRAE